jgi:hypothetical protein
MGTLRNDVIVMLFIFLSPQALKGNNAWGDKK